MKPHELNHLQSVSSPSLSPDAQRCVVSVTRPDFDADAYVGQLWELAVPGGDARRLTRGFRDTVPQHSPDGTSIGFLRAEPGGKPQLMIVDSRGGEPHRLTDQKMGVGAFTWSPDSSKIAFTSRVPDHGRYGTVDGVGPGLEDPRLITTFKYRMNGLGYTRDKRAQIFVLAVPDLDAEPFVAPAGRATEAAAKAAGADSDPQSHQDAAKGFPTARQLTAADADHNEPVFSRDGQRILFTSALHPDADATLYTNIYSMAVDGSDVVQLTNRGAGTRVGCNRPVESLDGNWLFFLGSDLSEDGLDFLARNTALYVAPANSPDEARAITDAETVDLGEVGDIVPRGADSVLVFNRTRGRGTLLEVSAEGSVTTLVDGELIVTGAAAARDIVVAAYTDPTTMGEVAVVSGGALSALTDLSSNLRAQTTVVTSVEETFTASDGYGVHGWVLEPEGEGPHPVLLNVHGGPFAQYGWGYFDEAQVYVDAGYAVVMCNPRGAAGYGQEHGRVIKAAMGTVDLLDVLGFLEGALEKYPALDRERLGVMGGSYGGYLTAWTISQDHRFTAAVVERGYLDPPSFVGSSDIGWFFSDAYTGSDPEQVRAQNPFAHVDKVETPTFVVHSEEDLRCPLEQAQRYYTALKLRGVPTELLVFPGETHELSRTGSPWHRRQRFDHILRWWATYLPTAQNQPS
ncbi:S9 family peptidase [Arthrobacter sp. H20]|uniref:S9 family peptidase n=1 Tax=Arthrobacter sp. H20 TaxID=1267981 RepID=UPI00047C68C3|nr:S9 family peptidase [Arthrobacter sp. H20]